jgi:SAM-dependent methyltransferase
VPITNFEWKAWGKYDPMFGVVNRPERAKDGPNPWTANDFYALGASDWSDFASHWRRYSGSLGGSAVEIGCGAGRVTHAMAADFARVQGVDVSEDQIELARLHTQNNVSFSLSDGDRIPLPDASVDAAFSCHVFQHLPDVAAALAYFGEIHRVLKQGGTMMIHVPVHQWPVMVSTKLCTLLKLPYAAFLPVKAAKTSLLRWRTSLGGKPTMHSISIDQVELFSGLSAMGFRDVELSVFPLTSNGAHHQCVLATKRCSAIGEICAVTEACGKSTI